MRTEKLYYQDPYLRGFAATLLDKKLRTDQHYDVILDRTAFYPEGGGQPCDLGSLNGLAVVDVQTQNDEIIHTVAGDPGAGPICGLIDWKRRFDLMQQHTGEHLLSGVLLSQHQAENVGFHLSSSSCQIDTTLPALSPELAAELENAVNAVIFANMPITARFVEAADLAGFKLRKQPGKEFEQIRLVSVEDCDCCPCGGTHVASSGEVGLFKIRGWEKRKKTIRIDFVCGSRALADYHMKHETARALSAALSAPIDGIVAAFEKNQEKLDSLQKELSAVRKAYHGELAARLLAEAANDAPPIIVQVFTGYSSADLLDFSGRIAGESGGICLLASTDPESTRSAFLFAAPRGVAVPMQELLRDSLAPYGGKGGGNVSQAQGGANVDDPAGILASAADLLRQRLQKKD